MDELEKARRDYLCDYDNDALFDRYVRLLRRHGLGSEVDEISEDRMLRRLLPVVAGNSPYPNAAATARLLIIGEMEPEDVAGYRDRIRPMYNFPSGSHAIMLALDIVLDTYGIEAHFEERYSATHPVFTFLNTGETYALTVVHSSGGFHVTSWGDFYEEWEKENPPEYEEDEEEDWSDWSY